MSRWTKGDEDIINQMRSRLQDELASVMQFPEVVGDRRLLRFYRGNERNVTKACADYTRFLNWRKDKRVDSIRQDIVHGGKNTPFKFPYGEKILKVYRASIPEYLFRLTSSSIYFVVFSIGIKPLLK